LVQTRSNQNSLSLALELMGCVFSYTCDPMLKIEAAPGREGPFLVALETVSSCAFEYGYGGT